jgi:hypothetical protein
MANVAVGMGTGVDVGTTGIAVGEAATGGLVSMTCEAGWEGCPPHADRNNANKTTGSQTFFIFKPPNSN